MCTICEVAMIINHHVYSWKFNLLFRRFVFHIKYKYWLFKAIPCYEAITYWWCQNALYLYTIMVAVKWKLYLNRAYNLQLAIYNQFSFEIYIKPGTNHLISNLDCVQFTFAPIYTCSNIKTMQIESSNCAVMVWCAIINRIYENIYILWNIEMLHSEQSSNTSLRDSVW